MWWVLSKAEPINPTHVITYTVESGRGTPLRGVPSSDFCIFVHICITAFCMTFVLNFWFCDLRNWGSEPLPKCQWQAAVVARSLAQSHCSFLRLVFLIFLECARCRLAESGALLDLGAAAARWHERHEHEGGRERRSVCATATGSSSPSIEAKTECRACGEWNRKTTPRLEKFSRPIELPRWLAKENKAARQAETAASDKVLRPKLESVDCKTNRARAREKMASFALRTVQWKWKVKGRPFLYCVWRFERWWWAVDTLAWIIVYKSVNDKKKLKCTLPVRSTWNLGQKRQRSVITCSVKLTKKKKKKKKKKTKKIDNTGLADVWSNSQTKQRSWGVKEIRFNAWLKSEQGSMASLKKWKFSDLY